MKTKTDFPREVVEWPDVRIPMPDGVMLSARIWLPSDAATNPVPAILEHLPYRKRDGTIARDQLTHPYLAGHGYACIRVDMRGSGDSEGLLFDEYEQQEWDDAIAVMAWARAQPWCTGKWGMMGISWGGFNALQVAALQPAGLGAIITLCSTVDRYADDIHFKGGCHLGANLSWAAQMLAYSSRPPDPDVAGDSWRDMWLHRLENQPFLLETWLGHQQRDDYWKHGSVCEDYAAINVPVLSIGGWHDGYRNTPAHIVANIPGSKAIVGPWNHKYPHFAGPEPRIGFLQEALRWWDKWLKGSDTDVQSEPTQRLYLMDTVPPERWVDERPGRWIGLDDEVPTETFHLTRNGLSRTPGPCDQTWQYQECGEGAGVYFPFAFGPELPGDQMYDDANSLCFDLKIDEVTEIVGAPKVAFTMALEAGGQQVAVRLCDVHPDGRSTLISHGFQSLSHRNSEVAVTLDQCAYAVPAGHTIRIALSGVYWPFIWPAPNAEGWTIQTGTLELPILGDTRTRPVAFPEPEAAPAWDIDVLKEAKMVRKVETTDTGRWLVMSTNNGLVKDRAHGLITGSICHEEWRLSGPNDTAKARIRWETRMQRGDWFVKTVCTAEMSADASTWFPRATIQAFEGKQLVFETAFSQDIPRNSM